jgi:ribosome-associated protein
MKKAEQEKVAGIAADSRVGRLLETTIQALEDIKAVDIRVLDVREQTSITDLMVIASGTSTRHVKSLADNVAEAAKQLGVRAPGMEGDKGSEWILVDLIDIVVHVMMPETRAFYGLEKLWSVSAGQPAAEHDRP